MRTKKLIASAVAFATLGAGGLTVATVNPMGGVGAQETPPTVAAPGATAEKRGEARGRGGRAVDEVLEGLVADKTLTEAQAEAVKAGLKQEEEEEVGDRHRRRAARRKQAIRIAAEAIGVSGRDLLAELKEGTSIAAVAEANDVEPQVVIDALVADASAHIDEAVAEEKLDADRAAKLEERLPEAMTKLVDLERTRK